MKEFRLNRDVLNSYISNQICADTLSQDKILKVVNKLSYKSIEEKIVEFKIYYKENHKIHLEQALSLWLKKKENYPYLTYKELILKRIKKSNYRSLATDQMYKDDQIDISH